MNDTDHHVGSDRTGRAVGIGDRVRVLAIRPSILKRLTGLEHADVSSMLGQTLEVFDVYENGQVWVSLTWVKDDGSSDVHAIAVDSEDIEKVDRQVPSVRPL